MSFSSHKPLPYQVSKIQEAAALLEVTELESLFSTLLQKVGPLYFYQIGAVVKKSELSFEEVLALYAHYLEALKKGKPILSFSLALTRDPTSLYKISLSEEGEIAKLAYPTLQIRPHMISYIPELQTFKKKLYGKDLIPWGIQFTYPQLFQEAITQEIHNALLEYPNGTLFKEIQRFLRNHSKPISFQTREGVIKSAIRLGPECESWVNSHPQLKEAMISCFLK